MHPLPAAGTLENALALLPGTGHRFRQLYASLWQLPELPPRALELCRLRLAQRHRSATDWQRSEVNVGKASRADLSRWQESGAFSAAERACLAFTEVYAMDAQAITDELAAPVTQSLGEAGLVALVEALGLLDGCIRLNLVWQFPLPATADSTERSP